jgi:hypothetical protein
MAQDLPDSFPVDRVIVFAAKQVIVVSASNHTSGG